MSRVFLLILDSFGIGGAPDAKKYGDEGANTFVHIAKSTKLTLPNLASLGLGLAAEASTPCTPGVLPGLIVNGRVTSPVQNIGLPATDKMGGNCALVLNVGPILSATLPAQPALGIPANWVVCH